MHQLTTLNDYRHAIEQAKDGRALSLLLYRALPLAYADMKIPYHTEQRIQVETNLSRRDDTWELWFNIQAPQAIKVLGHLHPKIFQRMSGGSNQASAIVKQKYGVGFVQQTVDFQLEKVFQEKEEAFKARLNAVENLQEWWTVMSETFPLALAKARGWLEPTQQQMDYANGQSDAFWREHGKAVAMFLNISGNIHGPEGKEAHVRVEWSRLSSDFNSGLNRSYLSLVSHHPWFDVDSNSMHSFKITGLRTDQLTQGLQTRGKDIVRAYCMVADTRFMPGYILRDKLTNTQGMEPPLELPALAHGAF